MEKQELTFEEVGTLADFVKPNESIYDDPINLRDLTKQIYVTFMNEGKEQVAICSWPITNMLRNKEIALGNLFDFPMSKASNGKYSIHGERRVKREHKRSALTIKKLVTVEVTDEETIVL